MTVAATTGQTKNLLNSYKVTIYKFFSDRDTSKAPIYKFYKPSTAKASESGASDARAAKHLIGVRVPLSEDTHKDQAE